MKRIVDVFGIMTGGVVQAFGATRFDLWMLLLTLACFIDAMLRMPRINLHTRNLCTVGGALMTERRETSSSVQSKKLVPEPAPPDAV